VPFKKSIDSAVFELLVGYLRSMRAHLAYLDERGGIIEDAVAVTALSELTFALDDINALKVEASLAAVRDACGDACYLLIELLEDAQMREAIMETFEEVKDFALQREDVNRIEVRLTDRAGLRHAIDYYWRARALMKYPAEELGIDISALDDPSVIVL
jgi:hypothetical protein